MKVNLPSYKEAKVSLGVGWGGGVVDVKCHVEKKKFRRVLTDILGYGWYGYNNVRSKRASGGVGVLVLRELVMVDINANIRLGAKVQVVE